MKIYLNKNINEEKKCIYCLSFDYQKQDVLFIYLISEDEREREKRNTAPGPQHKVEIGSEPSI